MTKEDKYYAWEYTKLFFPVVCLLIALIAEIVAVIRSLLA